MSEQTGFGFETGGVDEERLRAHSADFTPMGVVDQLYGQLLLRHADLRPSRLLDPCAGAGIFGARARRLWPKAHMMAIEPRDEEIPHLHRHYDTVAIGQAERILPALAAGPEDRFDIIATNPAFPIFMEIVEHGHAVLHEQGYLVLMGLSTWGQSDDAYQFFRRFTPAEQWRVTGRIHFRGDQVNPKTGEVYQSDQRDYSWWVWRPRLSGRHKPGEALSWRVVQLPPLSAAARSWRGCPRPGTEP